MIVLTCAPHVDALREGLRDLAIASESKARRTWAVVGSLQETDPTTLMDLGRFLVRLDISALVAVGQAGPVHAGAVLEGSYGEQSRHVASQEQATRLLLSSARPDDAVLVCGADEVLRAVQARS